jgi:molecular chaperone Hsp33
VRLAVGEVVTPQGTSWRAGGLMVQFLPQDPKRAVMPDWDPGDAPEGTAADTRQEDDAWVEAQAITATIADDELIDPGIEAERLLYRLFHERGVRVFQPGDVRAKCSCSRDKVVGMLRRFSADDRRHMVEDGRIKVTCEFCSTSHEIDPAEIGGTE